MQLQWLGDSYCTYLLDTSVIQEHQHMAAQNEDSNKFTNLLGTNNYILPTSFPIDEEMGQYDDLDNLEKGN